MNSLQTEESIRVGVDIGGTKTGVALLKPNGDVLKKRYFPTEHQRGEKNLADRVIECFESLLDTSGFNRKAVMSVGIGVPGSVNYETGEVLLAPNIFWKNVPLGQWMEEYFQRHVFIDYDTKASALAERIRGAGKNALNFAYVTISTGIGCGLILNGKIYRGKMGTAGEVGHVVVDPQGVPCHCGNRGCLQMYSSGPALMKQAKHALKNNPSSHILSLAEGIDRVKAEHVIEAAKLCDPLALAIFNNSMNYLAFGISHMINLLNLELIILGGGVLRGAETMILHSIKDKAALYAYPVARDCVRFDTSHLREDVGIIGAGLLPQYW